MREFGSIFDCSSGRFILRLSSYDIFAINIASSMLGYVYGKTTQGFFFKLSRNQELGVKVATPVGTLIGQLLFGWLADILGRKRMCECLPFFLL